MNHTHPAAIVGDVVSGAVTWFTYTGFVQREMEVGLLSEIAAAISILWFSARFFTWVWDRWNSRSTKKRKRCRCDEL